MENKEKKISYSEAIEELENIVSEIENSAITVDELSAKVKRASLLIRICREKLSSTEKEVDDIFKEMENAD